MKRFFPLLFFLGAGMVPFPGCGEKGGNPGEADHRFQGQVPCLIYQCSVGEGGGSGSSSSTPSPSLTYGITATVVRGVDTLNLSIPEGNVQIGETTLVRTITGFAAPASDLTITLSFTILSQARLPRTFRLVTGPPQGENEATLMYSEGVSDAPPVAITEVVSGTLTLNSFSATFVEGVFSGELILSNSARRFLQSGSIRVRRTGGG